MWWRELRPLPPTRRWWWSRPRPVAERALRRTVTAGLPGSAGLIPVRAEATPAGHLLQVSPFEQGAVVSVGLREKGTNRAGSPTPRQAASALRGVAGPSTDGPEGASLATRLRVILAPPLDRLLPGSGTLLEWPAPLLDYQLDGVRALIGRDRILLADDMGLGKTVQALAALRILCLQREAERARQRRKSKPRKTRKNAE